MSYATIEDLRSQLGSRTPAASTVAYAEKMLHKVPAAPVVDRAAFILEQCRGKRVLEFGASGPMHEAIAKVASSVYASDKRAPGVDEDLDLDDVSKPYVTAECADNVRPDVIVCGEVLEHLSNPGWFLTRLRRQYADLPVVFTVPNAFSHVAAQHIAKGVENVNRDHVAWYSYRTLMTLLERHGYTQNVFAWYTGQPHTAEGLIVVTE